LQKLLQPVCLPQQLLQQPHLRLPQLRQAQQLQVNFVSLRSRVRLSTVRN
ncbi:unnamed protein product, partial [Didymodactylos carnosus]